MTLIITSILAGTWGLSLAIVVVRLLGLKFDLKLDIQPYLINAMAILMLFGSSMYLLKTGLDIYKLFNSGERSYFSSVQFLTIFFAWPFALGILPQLLWITQFRQQLASLIAIAAVWTITVFFVPWSTKAFSPVGLIEMIGIYTVSLLLVYRFTSAKVKSAIEQRATIARLKKKYANSY